ncbi:hypothetical protein An05g00478 [Aspergillus niger]|uniref:Uncharacterized protein n=2 Tax=Aspergillus niger TaxID=5061 RepID=A2QKJ9_ASPNC|nr:hypothetical protein An05g00478 [Aspergillus niger]CAK39082.1 hypothetical protein An05g00478 [Aspergillus niger]
MICCCAGGAAIIPVCPPPPWSFCSVMIAHVELISIDRLPWSGLLFFPGPHRSPLASPPLLYHPFRLTPSYTYTSASASLHHSPLHQSRPRLLSCFFPVSPLYVAMWTN